MSALIVIAILALVICVIAFLVLYDNGSLAAKIIGSIPGFIIFLPVIVIVLIIRGIVYLIKRVCRLNV